MTGICFFIFLVSIFFAIFLKTWLQYKKTGINPVTFQRNSESVHDYVGNWFKFILGLIFVHVLVKDLLIIPKLGFLEQIGFQIFGIFLTISSLVLVIWAQQVMGNAWRIGIDKEHTTSLIITGPFQLSRNPIFVGMLISSFGVAVLIPTYLMWFLFILSWLLINIQVRLEEKYLLEVHGETYLAYKSTVGRFLSKWK
ncbi:MAG: isoprenylcysteine carboxylmethyltransferase family protein [Paenibacillus sp.]|nr:isoprenylcysteine carboxylmethyltransferase family protein [Paenibacillus sp.]